MQIPDELVIRRNNRTASFHANEWPELRLNPDHYRTLGIFVVHSYFGDDGEIEKPKQNCKPLESRLQQVADIAERLPLGDHERFGVLRFAVADALRTLTGHAPPDGSIDFLIKDVSVDYYGHPKCDICAVGYQKL